MKKITLKTFSISILSLGLLLTSCNKDDIGDASLEIENLEDQSLNGFEFKQITKSGIDILPSEIGYKEAQILKENIEFMNANEFEQYRTKMPENINDLYVGIGNPEANRVVIFSQGGPVTDLDTNYFSEYHKLFKEDYLVYAHQALTLKASSKFKNLKALTANQAETESKFDVQVLDKLVEHFKSKGKEVFLVGHSYGGYLVTKYIGAKSNYRVDKFLIMGSRLEESQLSIKLNTNGVAFSGYENGITLKYEPLDNINDIILSFLLLDDVDLPPNNHEDTEDFPGDIELPDDFLENFNLIKSFTPKKITEEEKNEFYIALLSLTKNAAIANNLIKTIEYNKNLSNVTFVHGELDEAVGRLVKKEVDFLTKRKVNVMQINSGGHDSMFFGNNAKLIYNLMMKN